MNFKQYIRSCKVLIFIKKNNKDLFKNESLSQVINNLEKLARISEDVFNRINKNILEKKTKLENLKSRINRASSIINSLVLYGKGKGKILRKTNFRHFLEYQFDNKK